ncbi:hypothetical protein CDD83_8565 [Cordyceps sp. RAO-2017]|nr:hypothetical protein CDD83_8565 [Cordyceps sp. RAO-2017]
MAIFTGGKSKSINSPRHLTLRHARRTVSLRKAVLGLAAAPDVDAEPDLGPGQERLNSFWAPGLEAGTKHRIHVSQAVVAPTADEPLTLAAEQDFFVDAPQFALPAGSVYFVYPPPGYADDCRILPHVVLTDPHLPWERLGSPKAESGGVKRNKVPWLALLTLTQDELRLPMGALPGLDFKQTATWTVKTTVSRLWELSNVTTPVTANLGEDIGASAGDFVFLKPDLFTSLFAAFDSSGKRVVPATPDTSRYQFLSHVRKVNTTGMAVGGVEDVGIFSVVIGGRCGPLQQTSPVSVSVHLVSIEGVEAMSTFPGSNKDYVALCSLHSWNYTVQPPGMLNVPDAMEHLGKTVGVLAPPASLVAPLESAGEVSARIAARLLDGYSLVRYRVQTGEQTVALYRGPFTPTVVSRLPQLDRCSTSGQDLQVLDKEVGIVDISYAAAWQVGRTLALGDQSYGAALVRLRTAIQTEALRRSKIAAVRQAGTPDSLRLRTDVLGSLPTTIADLDQIHLTPSLGDGVGRFTSGAPDKRWHRSRLASEDYPALGFGADAIRGRYLERATAAARDLAKATDGSIYNETNVPVSSDWPVVLAWLLDRMTLHGVPAHYLISDPSHLGPESLRFFHIDPNWVEAMLDGALSLGNHMGEDRDRVAIKTAVNDYLEQTPSDQPQPPQIPTYGFYLRSDIVTRFPDLRVTVLPESPAGTRPAGAPLLRHEIVADGVMLGLLDRVPGSADLTGLAFTQPPHQQRFAVGRGLAPKLLEIDVLRQYTVEQTDRERDAYRHEPLEQVRQTPSDEDNWLVWSSTPQSGSADLRLLRLPFYAEEQLRVLRADMGTFVDEKGQTVEFFDDDAPTSALLAMQLNDPVYKLIVPLAGEQAVAIQSLSSKSSPAPEPRTLRLVGVPGTRASAGADVQAPPSAPTRQQPEDPPGSSPAFGRHELYKPSLSDLRRDLGPHTRAAVYLTPRASPGSPPPGVFGSDVLPASPPTYTCAVYSLSAGRTTWDSVVPDPQHLAQDLVFSIQVGNNADSSYALIELDVAVPLGPVGATSNYLLAGYDGPGASMLSNLRFNVLRSFSRLESGEHCLLLRLLPRSSTGSVSVRGVRELGFLLALAKPNVYAAPMTLVTLYTTAYYTNGHEQDPIRDTFVVPVAKSAAGA